MAINIFRNVTVPLTTDTEIIYTAPAGFSAIVLMAQVSNITGAPFTVSAAVFAASTETSLVTDFEIPGNDAASILTGKLVLESGQAIVASANENSRLTMVMSILESQN